MIFQAPKPVSVNVFSMIILLTSCAQPPNYAPVKTVNERFEPNNGYIPEKKTINKTDNIQEPAKTPDKVQEIILTKQKPFITGTHPESNQHHPPKIYSEHRPLKTTKNKLTNLAVEKEKRSIPQKVPPAVQKRTDESNNISTISIIKTNNAQNNRISNEQTPNNPTLTKKNNKKSSISIDNKKVLKLNFQWPLIGRISRNFSQTENKGILISGKKGQSVYAAEAGKAVYCGQGLTGLGNLAIIKHSETYLSAYANNSKLIIKEGQQIEKGQTIGQVGLTGLRNSSLHFEIRKNGKPINPLTVLPRQ
jgi:murein DD-endopeptidase MepM/ murein hydrolase activator NlpD